MIAATAGTTNAGMIDPLHSCAELADRFGLWFHVDAAWGGALVVSDARKHVLAGMELADSVTIDAHKWLAVTMGSGMFLTRRAKVLSEAFRVSTSYMPSNDVDNDLYVNSMQWSRRFIGLRLFLSLAVAGWQGYEAHINHSIDLITRLITLMQAVGWQAVNNTQMAIACLRPPAGAKTPQQIVDAVVSHGQEWISVAQFEGQSVIRVCITNGMTEDCHVDQLAERLQAFSR